MASWWCVTCRLFVCTTGNFFSQNKFWLSLRDIKLKLALVLKNLATPLFPRPSNLENSEEFIVNRSNALLVYTHSVSYYFTVSDTANQSLSSLLTCLPKVYKRWFTVPLLIVYPIDKFFFMLDQSLLIFRLWNIIQP